MSMNRYAVARDSNELEIVRTLESVGATVIRLDTPVDLLVGFRGQTYLVEVKLPRGAKGGGSHSTLSTGQGRFFNRWRGGSLSIVRSAEDALRLIGATSDVEIGPRIPVEETRG